MQKKKSGPKSVIDDPKARKKIIQLMAEGCRHSLIANAFGVSEKTVSGWKRRKEFKKLLALQVLEIAEPAIKAVRERTPLAWLERHPEFREDFAPPTLKTENKNVEDVKMTIEFVEAPPREDED